MLVTQPLNPDPRIDREAVSLSKYGFTMRIVGLSLPGEPGYPEHQASITSAATKMQLTGQSWLFRLRTREWIEAVFKQIKFNYECIANLPRLIKGISIVHCNDADTLPMGWLISKMTGAKLVYDAHEYYAGMFSKSVPQIITKLVNSIERFFSRRVDLVITTGHLMAKRLKHISGKEPLQLRNAPYSSFSKGFHPQPKDAFIIGYVGALRVGRNLINLIKAFIKFNKEHPKSKLIIAGWGELENAIRRYADNSNGTIEFLGKIPSKDVPKVISSLSLSIVFTSKERINHYYACSNKLWEAAALGVPVLVTDVGELRYMVKSTNIGWTVNSDSISAIVAALTDIWNNSEELSKRGDIARTVFLSRISWDHVEHELGRAYMALCEP